MKEESRLRSAVYICGIVALVNT